VVAPARNAAQRQPSDQNKEIEKMPKIPSKLTGSAGEHFVAYRLSCLGTFAAPPHEGSPSVDILASNTAGERTIAIHVKSTERTSRTRGRGVNRQVAELRILDTAAVAMPDRYNR
jgi:hypothetical protein